MNYIYDILTNFNEVYYDFYEWNKKDNITHIKKIPIVKIEKNDFDKLISHDFKLDSVFIKKIKDKTEIWNNRKNTNDKNMLLITNGIDIIGTQFDDIGNCIKRSSLLVEEELDILQIIKKIETQNINYKLKQKIELSFKTRNEIKKKDFLINEMNKLASSNNIEKINFLYFECFNKKEADKNKAIKTIINNIEKENIFNILYDFFNLIKTSNK